MPNPRILAFAGSARAESYNHRLVQVAAEGARTAGADVTVLNLKDYPLPLFALEERRMHRRCVQLIQPYTPSPACS